jgi:hypothetical protein
MKASIFFALTLYALPLFEKNAASYGIVSTTRNSTDVEDIEGA